MAAALFSMSSKTILNQLKGGDRRSIGRANQLAKQAAMNPEIFRELIRALWNDDPLVRMRAADAAEKASAKNDRLLAPYRAELLGLLGETTQQEVRWHLAQMIPRLGLSKEERHRSAASLRLYLNDRSSIVRTFAMQALCDLAREDKSLREEVVDLIRYLTRTGSPAMRARGRKLLAQFDRA
jgi:hypothetical protein